MDNVGVVLDFPLSQIAGEVEKRLVIILLLFLLIRIIFYIKILLSLITLYLHLKICNNT